MSHKNIKQFGAFFGRVDRYGAFGQTRPKSAPAFRPRYCFLDKKVLKFSAFYQEKAGQSMVVITSSTLSTVKSCLPALLEIFLLFCKI